MSNEISVVNLADTIRDRVRTQIVSVIPDEQIDNLIKKEWDNFFTPPKKDNWSNKETESQFQILVKKQVNDLLVEKINTAVREHMSKFDQNQWNGAASVYIKEFVAGYAPIAMEGMARSVAMQSLQQITNNLNNQYPGRY